MTVGTVIGVDGSDLRIGGVRMAGVARWRPHEADMFGLMMGAMAVHAVAAGDASLQRRRTAIMTVRTGAIVDLGHNVGAGVADLALR